MSGEETEGAHRLCWTVVSVYVLRYSRITTPKKYINSYSNSMMTVCTYRLAKLPAQDLLQPQRRYSHPKKTMPSAPTNLFHNPLCLTLSLIRILAHSFYGPFDLISRHLQQTSSSSARSPPSSTISAPCFSTHSLPFVDTPDKGTSNPTCGPIHDHIDHLKPYVCGCPPLESYIFRSPVGRAAFFM